MKIAKGKTEGEHQAEEQAIAAAIKPAKPREKGSLKRPLPENEVKQVKEGGCAISRKLRGISPRITSEARGV